VSACARCHIGNRVVRVSWGCWEGALNSSNVVYGMIGGSVNKA